MIEAWNSPENWQEIKPGGKANYRTEFVGMHFASTCQKRVNQEATSLPFDELSQTGTRSNRPNDRNIRQHEKSELLRAADARASGGESLNAKPTADPGVSSSMELHEEPPAHGEPGGLSPADQSLVADLVADGLSIQDKFRPEPLYKQNGKGHYASNTVEEVRKAKQSKSKGKNR